VEGDASQGGSEGVNWEPLTPRAYRVILADPPWRFLTWNSANQKKSASAHYSLMTMAELKSLPVRDLAAPDCMLFMWSVQAMMPHALDLMVAWGFKYKTMGAWAKLSSTGKCLAFGTGYIYRSTAEFYIVGARGSPKIASRDVRNLIVSPTRQHSRKPDEMKRNIERLHPDCRRAELFSRESSDGWEGWGNETAKFDAGPRA
jgi:N6-adenosine-specific RNA methylase IME4